MIIAVGYRVNSKKATQFRIRSTTILKQYITKGYALNNQKLEQTGLDEIKKSLELLKRALDHVELTTDESRGLLELMTQYIPSLITLHRYDSDNLTFTNLSNEEKYSIDKQEALHVLHELRQELISKGEASDLFALDRNDGLDSIFGALYQTYDNQELYTSIEEKAAHLLYLIIKNHPFVDGNKRSGAFLFVRYLNKNNILKKGDGTHKISESSLVALALLVAMSKPNEKEHIVKLVMALIM
jgi:prophage maintenance system killer protein